MTAPNVQTLLIPEAVLATLQALSPEQRQQVFDFVEFLALKQRSVLPSQRVAPKKKRIFGQYAGRISMSADFDDPLPDEFWFGES